MPIGYVSANSEVRKETLNLAASELDSILRAVFQGKSFFAYRYLARGDDSADFHDRTIVGDRFFFGASGLWKVIPQVFGAVTEYDHNTYVAAAAALTVASYDEDKHLAICTEASWPLTGSLGVHTVEKDDLDYYLAQEGDDETRTIAERERFRRLPVAEIVCESMTELEWDERFTRYHFLRFHNLSLTELVVTLGETEITIPPLGIKAVRRSYPAGDEWDTSFTYLWKWKSGDSALWSGDLANNVGGLQVLHDWLDYITQANAQYGFAIRDPAVIWTPTTGSPFPAIDPDRRIVEYDKHAGRILAWKMEAGVAAEHHDIDSTYADLEGAGGPLKVTYDSGAHTAIIDALNPSEDFDAMGPESTLLPRYPVALPHTIASGAYASAACVGAYDPTGVNPGYSGDYRTSRADPTTWVDVDTGELPDDTTLSDWYTITFPEMTVGAALESFANYDSPALGTELTPDPDLAIVHDGFRLWLVGTHEFPATTRDTPVDRPGGSPDKFWWTIEKQLIRQTFGVDLTARVGWLHSTTAFGRHVLPQDGYISGGNAIQEGNPDVSGTYGINGGLDWEEVRTTHDEPTIKRVEKPNETQDDTLTLSVRPKGDVSERIVENADDVEWYTANQADLLTNTMNDDDKAGVVFYPILWSHFNHIAMRLNGIKAISPFLFSHVAYWGQVDDGTWPAAFSSNVPLDYYCAALSSGSRAVELGLTVQSITEAATTGYYLTITDVAAKAESLGLAMAVEGIFAYRTELVPPDVTDQAFWRWTHSNSATNYRAGYLTVADSPWAVTRRTISAEGYSIYSLGATRFPQEHIVGFQRSVDFPELPDGWIEEAASRVLCAPTKAIGWVNDPLMEPRSIEEPPAGAWSTDYEETAVYDAPTGDPKYLEIGTELQFPADHAGITAAMDSYGDDRSEWHITYIPRLLLVRQPTP